MRIAPVALTCIATATLALAACEPAPEDGTHEQPSPENIAEVEGTASGDLDTEPDKGGNRAAQVEAGAPANARWFIDEARAAFGPPESEAMLSIRCADGTLTVQRIVGRPLDGDRVASMNILGNRAKALVRVTGEESELGGSLWQGEVDDPGQFARVIGSGQGAITIDIDGEDEIGIAPSQEAADFVRNCG